MTEKECVCDTVSAGAVELGKKKPTARELVKIINNSNNIAIRFEATRQLIEKVGQKGR